MRWYAILFVTLIAVLLIAYVGTSNGQVYASIDGGDHWDRLPGTLPPVLSVTCAVY